MRSHVIVFLSILLFVTLVMLAVPLYYLYQKTSGCSCRHRAEEPPARPPAASKNSAAGSQAAKHPPIPDAGHHHQGDGDAHDDDNATPPKKGKCPFGFGRKGRRARL